MPDTDRQTGQSNGCASAYLSSMHHHHRRQGQQASCCSAISPRLVEHAHPIDCLTATSAAMRNEMLLSSRAATADSTEAGLACVPEGWPAHCHARILLQTPLSTRRAMFRKESRRESRHRIAETSKSDRVQEEWGLGASAGSGPLSSHPLLHPMLFGGDQLQRCSQEEGSRRRL